MIHAKRCILVMITFILISPVMSTCDVYYVDKNHPSASDSNNGSESSPWKTIQHAVDIAVAGDTALVKEGIYNEAIEMVRSGTSSDPIIFRVYGTDVVVIDGSGISTTHKLIFWDGAEVDKNWIIFDGFEVRNAVKWGVWVQGDHNTIINNRIHDCGTSGDASGLVVEHGKYNRIAFNEAFNNSWNGLDIEDSEYSVIEYNTTYNNGHQGINVFSDTGSYYGLMRENHIRNNISYNNVACGIYTRYLIDNVISNNLVYDNTKWGIILHKGGTGAPSNYEANTRIYNNTVVGNGYDGIYICSANRVEIKNNILSRNNVTGDAKAELRVDKIDNHVIDYNLYDAGSGTEVCWYGEGKITLDEFRELNGSIYEQNGIAAVAGFVNKATSDFRLNATSPAIDIGINLSSEGISTDIEDISRPQQDFWDIGAYEWVSGSGEPPTPLEAPSKLRIK